MELYLPRREIVRQMRAHLGLATDAQLAAAVQAQHLAAVSAAALRVQGECSWSNLVARVTVTLGAEQNVLNYPSDSRPGSIRGIAVYASDRYYALEPRVLPVQTDTDQEVIVGQPTLARVLGRPNFYQQRDQIYLYPRSDQAYPVRIEYTKRVEMDTDDEVSIIDAQLIIFAAAVTVAATMGDEVQAKYFSGLYDERMRMLRGWQQAGTRFAMDSEADFAEEEFIRDELLPNWSRGPTLPP